MDSVKPNFLEVFDRKKIKVKTKILTSARCTEIMQNKCVWWKQNLVYSLWGKNIRSVTCPVITSWNNYLNLKDDPIYFEEAVPGLIQWDHWRVTLQEGWWQQLYQGMKRVQAESPKRIGHFKDKKFQSKITLRILMTYKKYCQKRIKLQQKEYAKLTKVFSDKGRRTI